MLDASNPTGFFTTLADKMLRSTFSFGVTNIPVYTNGIFVYTPSVQRLLQLSANIYDATTNRSAVFGKDFPSVFRPLFTATASGDLFITGYTNIASVTNASDIALSTPFDAATVAAAGGTNVPVNVYGVPWIIGVKKGFPSFNQFSMLSAVQVTRKLQVTKPSLTATIGQFQTNQMYVFNISNLLGCSLWNAYTSAYSGNLSITFRDKLTIWLTSDDLGFTPYGFTNFPVNVTVAVTNWPGTLWLADPPLSILANNNNSLIIPFNTTNEFLPNAIYRYAGFNGLASSFWDVSDLNYQTSFNTTGNSVLGLTPPLPNFGLLATNRLQVMILDCDTNNVTHVIDYVQFAGPDISLDLNANLADPNSSAFGTPAYFWSTNGYQGGTTPWGVVNQINVSLGKSALPSGETWNSPQNLPLGLPSTVSAEQDFFSGFFDTAPTHPGVFTFNGKLYTNTFLAMQVPYTPSRIITNFVSWQANDPLVHYLASDLEYDHGSSAGHIGTIDIVNFTLSLPFANLITFSPWGQNNYPFHAATNYWNATWLTWIKDPLVWNSDNWNFPAGLDWSLSAIGRVHRGTPWQTVYLKATDILATGNTGLSTWAQWTGNSDFNDAKLTAPINDWQLVGLLLPLLNTNDPTQLMSVNDPNPADWANALNGLTVLTNSGPDYDAYITTPPLDAISMVGSSPQASFIASAIASVRTNQPSQRFQSLGGILQTVALNEQSPWLNCDAAQQQYGITDEAYEAIPAQLLPLLRPDSIGAVVQSNGGWNIQFSGSDAYTYTLQTSTDMINWTVVSTNNPVQGSFCQPIPPTSASQKRFYRTVLLH